MSRLLYLKNHMNVRICALLWCFLRCVNNSRMVLYDAGKPVQMYGKGFMGVRKRLCEDVIRAFSQRGKGFFARRERTDAVPVLSIYWYTTVYAVSSKPTCYVAGF